MPRYLNLGSVPRKRHIEHRQSPGYRNEGIYYEEVVTLVGFGRAYSIVYHMRPPTRVRKIETVGAVKIPLAEDTVLRHHHLKSGNIPRSGDPIRGRLPIL